MRRGLPDELFVLVWKYDSPPDKPWGTNIIGVYETKDMAVSKLVEHASEAGRDIADYYVAGVDAEWSNEPNDI